MRRPNRESSFRRRQPRAVDPIGQRRRQIQKRCKSILQRRHRPPGRRGRSPRLWWFWRCPREQEWSLPRWNTDKKMLRFQHHDDVHSILRSDLMEERRRRWNSMQGMLIAAMKRGGRMASSFWSSGRSGGGGGWRRGTRSHEGSLVTGGSRDSLPYQQQQTSSRADYLTTNLATRTSQQASIRFLNQIRKPCIQPHISF